MKEFTGGKFALQALTGGSLDLVTPAELPVTLATLNGEKLSVLAEVNETAGGFPMILRKEGDVFNAQTYFAKKRKIATSVGGGPEYFTVDFFKKYNIAPSQYEIVSMKKELGISMTEVMSRIPKGQLEQSSCSYCGVFRRKLLNEKAGLIKAKKIATGHNLDDEAQNIIMNVFKNHTYLLPRLGPKTGLAEHKGFVPRIKPLYFCEEGEVMLYSKLNNFPVKYEKCPCRADAYRKEVAEMLNEFEKHHKGTKSGIIRSFLEILPAVRILRDLLM